MDVRDQPHAQEFLRQGADSFRTTGVESAADVYIPGGSPRPEAMFDGSMELQARIQVERVPADGLHQESAGPSQPGGEKARA